jgi:hypothetical protein
MNAKVFDRFRRPAVFIAVNLLAAAGAYAIAVDPIVTVIQERHQQIDQKAQAFVRMASLVEREQLIENVAKESDEVLKRSFLQGESSTMLNADLLSRLRQSADRHQVSFNSVASLPQRNWHNQVLASARVEFVASSLKASELLADLEAGQPFLFIHSAKLTAAASQDGGEETVAVALEVYGATRWHEK